MADEDLKKEDFEEYVPPTKAAAAAKPAAATSSPYGYRGSDFATPPPMPAPPIPAGLGGGRLQPPTATFQEGEAPPPSAGQRFIAGVKSVIPEDAPIRNIPEYLKPETWKESFQRWSHPLTPSIPVEPGSVPPPQTLRQEGQNLYNTMLPTDETIRQRFAASPVGQAVSGNIAGAAGQVTPQLPFLLAGLGGKGGRTTSETSGLLERGGARVEAAAPTVGRVAGTLGTIGKIGSQIYRGQWPNMGDLIELGLMGPVGGRLAAGGTQLIGKGMQAVGRALPTTEGMLPGEVPRGETTPPISQQPPQPIRTQARIIRHELPSEAGPGAAPPGAPARPMPSATSPRLPTFAASTREVPVEGVEHIPPPPERPVAGMLPSAPREVPPTPLTEPGEGGTVPAAFRVVKNPLTGKMQRQYVTSAAPEGKGLIGYGSEPATEPGLGQPQPPPPVPPAYGRELIQVPPEIVRPGETARQFPPAGTPAEVTPGPEAAAEGTPAEARQPLTWDKIREIAATLPPEEEAPQKPTLTEQLKGSLKKGKGEPPAPAGGKRGRRPNPPSKR